MLLIGVLAFTLLFLACPFYVMLLVLFLVARFLFFPEISTGILVQQIFSGIKPLSFVCVPMFMLAANIMTSGNTSKKIVNLLRAYIGHIPGALPIITTISSMLFGSVSGSTQATVAAIGGVMRPLLLEAGYSSSFSFGLIINSSDIATLIPPGVAFIIYGIVAQISIGKLFLAGIGPGVLVTVLFSIFCYFYSELKNIGIYPKASWKERKQSTKESIPLIGFPIIILGGIYAGILSPTEAAATSVFYALVLEGLVYRTLTFKKLFDIFLSTAMITAIVMLLVGTGRALGWLAGYSKIGEIIFPPIFGNEPSALKVILIISIAYFINCMFTSPIIGYYIFTPIFAPYIAQAGIDEILIGVLVVMQAAIGSATPPFGCDIFTAMAVFKRPYLEVIRMTWPFILILLLAVAIVIIFPEVALFIPKHAFGG